MKFLMSRSELCHIVNNMQNIVGQRTPMPILSNIFIEAADSKVTITATDLTVGVKCSGPAKVLEPGATTIPARRLAQLLKELNVSYIEISTNEKEISQLIADTSIFRMNGMPKADYPELPDFTGAQRVVVKQKDLYNALYKTAFAVSKDETRYILTGLSFTINEETAFLVGTDGKRLARVSLPVQVERPLSYGCVMPLKAVNEILGIIKQSDENAIVFLLQDKIEVETTNGIVMTKLLAGEFPEAERIIPSHSVVIVPLHREELESLLRQIILFISDENNSVRFTFQDGFLHLTVNTSNIGEGKVSMAVNYTEAQFDIAFNALFFLDILKHSQNEYIYLGFQDSFNPVILSDVEFSIDHTLLPSPLYVLMPLRLNS